MHSDRLGALPDAGEVALPAGKRFHLDFKSSEARASRRLQRAGNQHCVGQSAKQGQLVRVRRVLAAAHGFEVRWRATGGSTHRGWGGCATDRGLILRDLAGLRRRALRFRSRVTDNETHR